MQIAKKVGGAEKNKQRKRWGTRDTRNPRNTDSNNNKRLVGL